MSADSTNCRLQFYLNSSPSYCFRRTEPWPSTNKWTCVAIVNSARLWQTDRAKIFLLTSLATKTRKAIAGVQTVSEVNVYYVATWNNTFTMMLLQWSVALWILCVSYVHNGSPIFVCSWADYKGSNELTPPGLGLHLLSSWWKELVSISVFFLCSVQFS